MKSFKSFYLIAIVCLSTSTFLGYAQNDSLSKIIPAEYLLKQPTQSNFRISPNGKLFLEVVEESTENYVVVIDIDAYKLKYKFPVKSYFNISDVTWLNNKRLLYEAGGEIYAIDIDGTNNLKLVDRLADKIKKSYYKFEQNLRFNSILSLYPKSEDEILIQAFDVDGNAYAKLVNVYTGESKITLNGKKLKINRWIEDKNGKIIIGVRYDKKGWTYFRKNIVNDDWSPMKLNINGTNFTFTIQGKSFVSDNVLLVSTDFDPDVIYLSSNICTDKRHLLKYNFIKESVLDTIVSDVNCDISSDDNSDISLLFDYQNKELGAVRYEGLRPQFKSLNTKFLDLKAKIDKKYPQHVNDIIDYDNNYKRLVIYQWSDIYEGNIGIYDVEKDEYYVMFQFNNDLNDFELLKTKIISVTTDDDYTLPCYITFPKDYEKSKDIPLVVLPHGGPWVRDYWALDVHSQYFSSRGYAVLRINYRGSVGFGKKHFRKGIEGLGSTMIDDIVFATKKIIKDYKINKDEVFIYGHSYGGYATYMSLARYPDVYKAGVAVAAPTDIKKLMKFQKKEGNHFSYEFWEYALGENGSKYYNEVSQINYVQDINPPLLVFHGKYDRIVPKEQAEAMEKQFKKLNKTNATFRMIQFLGHSLEDSNSHGYVLKESEKFFRDSISIQEK